MTERVDYLNEFQTKLSDSINGAQKWWTKYLFHFTDISNALLILETGSIYSRDKVHELDLMKNDNANDSVIANTSEIHKKYVRLYFGPSTPTQYSNEGIKPKDCISENAHCPIPIMFVFDFIKIFMLDEIKFTDGNLATQPNIFNDVKDLEKLDFNMIYHRTWFEPQDRAKIINARHSEVLVKNELSLEDNLSVVVVRSEAEKETLLYQMDDELRDIYQKKIFIQPQTGIFINEWFYINNVSIIDNIIHIKWHYCSRSLCNGKFELKVIVKKLDDGIKKSLSKTEWHPESNMNIPLPQEFKNKNIEILIVVDNINAYVNSFDVM